MAKNVSISVDMGIDKMLFREQKECLLKIMVGLQEDERELLEGIMNILEAIQDEIDDVEDKNG